MATLSAYGLSVEAPAGWDASIYKRKEPELALQRLSADQAAEHAVEYQPILHLCTRPLPVVRGDLGGGIVSELGPGDVFLVLFEYSGESAATPLFAKSARVPWPLKLQDFSPAALRTQLPDQVGCQQFFSVNGRGFMLYVVLGSAAAAPTMLVQVNAALAGVRID